VLNVELISSTSKAETFFITSPYVPHVSKPRNYEVAVKGYNLIGESMMEFAQIFKRSYDKAARHNATVKAWLSRVRAAKPTDLSVAVMSPEDAKVIDLKPDRPLQDPKAVLEISKILPDSTYCSYSKLPFLAKMNALIGVDPAKDIKAYAKARKAFFYKLPEEQFSLDNLVVTQKVVNEAKIKANIEKGNFGKGGGTDVFVVRYRGKDYIIDGHHRVMAAKLSGKKNAFAHIERRVLDMGTTKLENARVGAL
jgi:hypothetical protein